LELAWVPDYSLTRYARTQAKSFQGRDRWTCCWNPFFGSTDHMALLLGAAVSSSLIEALIINEDTLLPVRRERIIT